MRLGVLLLMLAHAHAAPVRVILLEGVGGRINPLGLENQLHVGPSIELYPSARPVLRDNFLYFGLAPKLSPSRSRMGVEAELQPVSIFNLRVVAELVSYFGVIGSLQSFGSPLDAFSDTAIDRGDKAGRAYHTNGAHLAIQPTLQVKFGPIAIVDRLSIDWFAMNLHDNDRVFYDGGFDTLISRDGWVIQNDIDVVYLTRFRLVAGLRYTVMQPLYRPSDYRPDENPSINPNRMQRLGPLLAYTVFEKPRHRIRNLTIGLVVGWYLEQRWRTGADVSTGVPWGTLALWFYSDLVQP
jgi:hypothetical protein